MTPGRVRAFTRPLFVCGAFACAMTSTASVFAGSPPADEIRRTALEVVSRREFRLEMSRRPADELWWLEWLLWPIRWLFNSLEGVPEILRWPIVIVLLVVLVLLCWHIGWTFLSALKAPQWEAGEGTRREMRISPRELEALAERLASNGDWIGAIRQLFLASVLRLEDADQRKFRKGSTNHEILKRYRKSEVFEPLQRLVDLIDTRWYGLVPCVAADYDSGLAEHRRILQCLATHGSQHAAGA
jgi:hypothetical protein